MDLTGKIAVVTGGRRGIGKAIAKSLHAAGARVAIADLDKAEAHDVGKACGGYGTKVDVTNEADIAHFLTGVERKMGPVDIFVSNAGVARSDGPTYMAAGAPNAAWELSWQVNVMSSVYAARHVVPGMIKRGQGIFMIVASAAGLLNQMGSAPYSCTKHAAVSFAESLSIAHAHQGLRVLCICPQGVQTDLIQGAETSLKAVGAILQPEDVATAMMAALDDGRSYVFPHPETLDYFQSRAADPDKWLQRMGQARQMLAAKTGRQM
ncbi:SDR family NAD(P)-dependent oxidoreductase [Parasulfitobacter algicola]|uniref:SDR family NAD(P)-dependent oxidoreductase n=1 Tax=Parasulfitobacter algicola TaxID=2614809 RepID=A0ABX2IMG0_9RHOB|nr:SDR family NAD(P)-dependent oxidoreductase [Sulfitobacter algicola]NSX54076.1 SDR family NAD(P)-dependent oxidoreductase [Sulfitobacter algicola]